VVDRDQCSSHDDLDDGSGSAGRYHRDVPIV